MLKPRQTLCAIACATQVLVAACFCAIVLSLAAQAANLKVNCNRPGEDEVHTITAALKRLDPVGPNTVTVAGACNENVVIQGFDRLNLVASPGASISDASSGQSDVVSIVDSQRVLVQGFTINGGANGISCSQDSICRLDGNTVQNSSGNGVIVGGRSRATLGNNLLRNNGARGLSVIHASNATSVGDVMSGNAAGAAAVSHSSIITQGSTFQNNTGPGLVAGQNSTLRVFACTITGNLNGISLAESGVAQIPDFGAGPTNITGNAINGVSVGDVSFASFVGANVTGNHTSGSGLDVFCAPQFSATRGTSTDIGGGTTNCTEP